MKRGACVWRQFGVVEENASWRIFMDDGSLTSGPGFIEGFRPSASWFG